MPKIEVNERLFFALAEKTWTDKESFEQDLTVAKAELDEWDMTGPADGERTIKIELNDTNRPDLWSTAGLARQLRIYRTGKYHPTPFSPRARRKLRHHTASWSTSR